MEIRMKTIHVSIDEMSLSVSKNGVEIAKFKANSRSERITLKDLASASRDDEIIELLNAAIGIIKSKRPDEEFQRYSQI